MALWGMLTPAGKRAAVAMLRDRPWIKGRHHGPRRLFGLWRHTAARDHGLTLPPPRHLRRMLRQHREYCIAPCRHGLAELEAAIQASFAPPPPQGGASA